MMSKDVTFRQAVFLENYNIYSAQRWMPDEDGKGAAIVFWVSQDIVIYLETGTTRESFPCEYRRTWDGTEKHFQELKAELVEELDEQLMDGIYKEQEVLTAKAETMEDLSNIGVIR
jgi:hypothetical protein